MEKFWEYFNLFWSVRQSRTAAGWMWEGHVLLLLERETLELSLKPLSNGQPETFRTPFEDSAHYTDRKSLADKLSNFVFSTKNSIFLQPGSRNQATFDAFSISRDGIVTFPDCHDIPNDCRRKSLHQGVGSRFYLGCRS